MYIEWNYVTVTQCITAPGWQKKRHRLLCILASPALCFILVYNCGLTVRNKRIRYVIIEPINAIQTVFVVLQISAVSVAAWMCVVTHYCLAVLLADCSTLPVRCKRSSVGIVSLAYYWARCNRTSMGLTLHGIPPDLHFILCLNCSRNHI